MNFSFLEIMEKTDTGGKYWLQSFTAKHLESEELNFIVPNIMHSIKYVGMII